MKASRESQNLSLKEVIEGTKIREHLLKAIEEDRYEIIKYPAYLKGFLKSYAKFIGLNPDDVVSDYQKYLETMIPLRAVPWDIPESHIPVYYFPWKEGIIAHTSSSSSTFPASTERGVKYGQSRCKGIPSVLWERDQIG